MTQKQIKSLFGFIAAIIVLALGIKQAWLESTATEKAPNIETATTTTTSRDGIGVHASGTNALVTKVVDGDTIDVRLDAEPETEYRVRFLGVNTPETVDPRKTVECFGKEASDFSKKTLTGKRINLVADPEADERDKYNRLLRFIYLEDGTNYNYLLVSEGYAQAYLSFPLGSEYKTEIRQLEREAKEAGVGMWASGACGE